MTSLCDDCSKVEKCNPQVVVGTTTTPVFEIVSCPSHSKVLTYPKYTKELLEDINTWASTPGACNGVGCSECILGHNICTALLNVRSEVTKRVNNN